MNDACCTRPAIKSDSKPVGTYSKLSNGMDIYTTGSATAKRGLILAYDALGYSDPLLLGADVFASTLDAVVFVPDMFRGAPLSSDFLSMPASEEKTAMLHKWFAESGDFGRAQKALAEMHAELRAAHPAAAKWAFFGYCWGGKLAAIVSGAGSAFDASGAAHAGRLDEAEARAITIPHVFLPSGEDGTKESLTAYHEALKASGQDVRFEWFEDQVHGWMAARADLADDKVRAEFERGYAIACEFFAKHL